MRLILWTALLATLILAGFSVGTSAQTPQACTPCALSVDRIVQTNDWGTTSVNDTVTVNTAIPATYLDLGVPSAIAEKMGLLAASDSQGMPLRTIPLSTNQLRGYVPIRVELPGTTGEYSISVSAAFSGLLSFNNTANRYTLTYSPFPVVDDSVTVDSAALTVKTGDWAQVIPSGINGTWSPGTFQTTTNNLGPYNTTLGELSFASATQNNFEVTANREITISQSAKMLVADAYDLTNRGRDDVASLTFLLPEGTVSISGSDVIGRLEDCNTITSTRACLRAAVQDNGTSVVTFFPRFGAVESGGGANVRLDYELLNSVYVATESLGRYSLNFRMFDNVKFVQATLQTKVLLPAGFKLETITWPDAVISDSQIILEASRVSPLSDLTFSLSYRLDPFWASFSPLVWVGLIAGALAASVLVLGVGTTKTAAMGLAPSGIIGRFVDLFDEKATLRLEYEKLEEDMSRGALARHEFKRRRRMIDIRTSEIERQIGPLKQELTSSSPRYPDLLRRIEKAEAELQVVRSSMSDLRNQYRSGRIAKESFESLNSDLVRRKEKAQQTIDNIVIGFREEAR